MPKANEDPAFPGYTMHEDGETVVVTKLNPGMTLRDFFAAKALLVADDNIPEMVDLAAAQLGMRTEEYDCFRDYPRLLAKSAYAIADVMLEARKN